MLVPWKESYDKARQCIKKQRHHFANKGPSSRSYGLSRSHVQMWELDHKESWALKNWCFQTVVLEKTLESPLDSKEIKPVNHTGNQPWIFNKGLMLKMKLQYFGHLMWRADSLKKILVLGRIKGRRRRGYRGWHSVLGGNQISLNPWERPAETKLTTKHRLKLPIFGLLENAYLSL